MTASSTETGTSVNQAVGKSTIGRTHPMATALPTCEDTPTSTRPVNRMCAMICSVRSTNCSGNGIKDRLSRRIPHIPHASLAPRIETPSNQAVKRQGPDNSKYDCQGSRSIELTGKLETVEA
jgi:hypothetical protein